MAHRYFLCHRFVQSDRQLLPQAGGQDDAGIEAALASASRASIGSAAASRCVSDGRPNRVSMNRKTEVWTQPYPKDQ